tara:strand:- start:505 stop:825 length:321 start_codon:yes stop_codon:yes gene_type:complete
MVIIIQDGHAEVVESEQELRKRKTFRVLKTNRKRNRRMCHGDYLACKPEIKTVEGKRKTINLERDPNSKDWSNQYIFTPFKELHHFECTKGNKAPRIEDITGDEEQ